MFAQEHKDIVKVLNKNRAQLVSASKVRQMGVGYKVKNGKLTDTVGIVIFVTSKPSDSKLRSMHIEPVSKEIEGIPTDIIEIPGGFKPRAPDDLRHRPFCGGVATIHCDVPGTGTLGLIVNLTTDNKKLYALTNNHVGANEDVKGLVPVAAKKGDKWIQPGAHGGGQVPIDVIAKLYKWNKLLPGSPNVYNYYDAAIAEVVKDSMPDAQAYNVMDIGPVKGMEDINLGDQVLKRGRTTLKTKGVVTALIPNPQKVTVEYREYCCDFTDQVVIAGDPQDVPFSQPGDSGSIVVSATKDKKSGAYPVKALLFAGGTSSDNIDFTIASPISKLVQDFKLKL